MGMLLSFWLHHDLEVFDGCMEEVSMKRIARQGAAHSGIEKCYNALLATRYGTFERHHNRCSSQMGETGQTGLRERSALTGYTMRETGRTGLRERSAHTGSTHKVVQTSRLWVYMNAWNLTNMRMARWLCSFCAIIGRLNMCVGRKGERRNKRRCASDDAQREKEQAMTRVQRATSLRADNDAVLF